MAGLIDLEEVKKRMNNFFFPPQVTNIFDAKRYITDLEKGVFRDYFCLGVVDGDGGKWLLKDFFEEPHALFVGATGSGKSVAAAFTCVTYMAANSDQTIMFVCDTAKGAADFSPLFGLPQVYKAVNEKGYDADEGVRRVFDLGYSEAMARQELLNEGDGAPKLTAYEQKKGVKLARIVIVMDEFHMIPYKVLDFDKNFKKKYTAAEKFHTLMRIGRSLGIFVIGASQKSTKSDIPSEVVGSFLNKIMFKVSPGEAHYVLGDGRPALLKGDQKGRAYSESGMIQFPIFGSNPKSTAEVLANMQLLLAKYAKPLNATCAYLNPQLISDYLNGKDTKELYKNKKLSELAETIESLKGELVLEVLHEKLGQSWKSVDSRTDLHGICGIVTDDNGEKFTIMYDSTGKVTPRSVENLCNSAKKHGALSGILYCPSVGLSTSVHKSARGDGLIVFDHNDLIRIARQIDSGRVDLAHQMYELPELEERNQTDGPMFDQDDDFYKPTKQEPRKQQVKKTEKSKNINEEIKKQEAVKLSKNIRKAKNDSNVEDLLRNPPLEILERFKSKNVPESNLDGALKGDPVIEFLKRKNT